VPRPRTEPVALGGIGFRPQGPDQRTQLLQIRPRARQHPLRVEQPDILLGVTALYERASLRSAASAVRRATTTYPCSLAAVSAPTSGARSTG